MHVKTLIYWYSAHVPSNGGELSVTAVAGEELQSEIRINLPNLV